MQENEHKLAIICTRYAELNMAAKAASTAVCVAKLKLMEGITTSEEFATLQAAIRILDNIANNTGFHNAIQHHKKN